MRTNEHVLARSLVRNIRGMKVIRAFAPQRRRSTFIWDQTLRNVIDTLVAGVANSMRRCGEGCWGRGLLPSAVGTSRVEKVHQKTHHRRRRRCHINSVTHADACAFVYRLTNARARSNAWWRRLINLMRVCSCARARSLVCARVCERALSCTRIISYLLPPPWWWWWWLWFFVVALSSSRRITRAATSDFWEWKQQQQQQWLTWHPAMSRVSCRARRCTW